jgi:hypothetical protein
VAWLRALAFNLLACFRLDFRPFRLGGPSRRARVGRAEGRRRAAIEAS